LRGGRALDQEHDLGSAILVQVVAERFC